MSAGKRTLRGSGSESSTRPAAAEGAPVGGDQPGTGATGGCAPARGPRVSGGAGLAVRAVAVGGDAWGGDVAGGGAVRGAGRTAQPACVAARQAKAAHAIAPAKRTAITPTRDA